jgi:selenocysteine-specific elongation factor
MRAAVARRPPRCSMATPTAHAVIGTAGHIDHGKTALIKALTGLDTDRLKEEKERGISIDLGFAHFTLPDGTRAGVIDVPGHERFIRNMLAGAHGIDLVLFAVAADDGVMPQTEEHLDILHLLGISRGIFLITKADLADSKRIAEVREEIEILADGTSLEGSPIIPISSISGLGLEQLKAEIARQLNGFQARRATGLFRLPIDRAFTIKGHGSVVTGTAMGAEVRLGQKLRVLPINDEVRVRAIQVHGDSVDHAGLSQRVALNLSGAEKLELHRGLVLADDRLDLSTARLDTLLEIRPAAKRPLKQNQRVRFFIGAAETIGRVILLDAPELAPKNCGLAQIVLDDPVVALAADRFVIRDETNVRTLGGGRVLNPFGRRSRKPLENYVRNLRSLTDGFGPDAVEAMINLQETLALGAARIAQLFNLPVPEIEAILKSSAFIRLSLGEQEGFTTKAKWDELARTALDIVADHHRREPLAAGFEMESLRVRLPYEVEPRAFRNVLDRLARETELAREESLVRLKSHRVQLGGETGELGNRIERLLNDAGFQPPDLKQLAESLKLSSAELPRLRSVLGAIERQGRVVKIAADFYFARTPLEAARAKLIERLQRDGEISAATYRDSLNASRKFAIALLDYFDHSGVTIRVGDIRRLRTRQS